MTELTGRSIVTIVKLTEDIEPMKITLPARIMAEGLRRGARAPRPVTKPNRYAHHDDAPTDVVRFTVTKQRLTFESGDERAWVSHTIPVDGSVTVEVEGTYCFKIKVMYATLRRHKGPASTFEMTYTAPTADSTTANSFGTLFWTVRDGRSSSRTSVKALPANTITTGNDLYGNGHDGHDDQNDQNDLGTEVLLLELSAQALERTLRDLHLRPGATGTTKATRASGPTMISPRNGYAFAWQATQDCATVVEFGPSSIISQGPGQTDLPTPLGIKDLGNLKPLLAGSRKAKMFLCGGGQHVRIEAGRTSLYLPLEAVHAESGGYPDPITAMALAPQTSIIIDTTDIQKALNFACSSVMKSTVIHAHVKTQKAGLKLKCWAGKDKHGELLSPYPAESTCPCDTDGNTPVKFNFAPKPLASFLRGIKDGKLVIDIIDVIDLIDVINIALPDNACAAGARTAEDKAVTVEPRDQRGTSGRLMRVRAGSNSSLTFISCID